MFDAGAVVGRMILSTQDFQNTAEKVKNQVAQIGTAVTNMGRSVYMAGRQISNVGRNLAFFGAAITGPLILAFKTAEKYSNSVRNEMQRLENVMIAMRTSVAESMIPTMHRLSNVLAELYTRWEGLSPALRDSIINGVLMGGVFLAVTGIAMVLVGKLAMLVGGIWRLVGGMIALAALHPGMALLAAAVVALAWAMWKCDNVARPVLNFMEKATLLIGIGWEKVKIAIANVEIGLLRLGGKFTKTLREGLSTEIYLATRRITDMSDAMAAIDMKGAGAWSEGFEGLKTTLADLQGLMAGLGATEFDIPHMLEASRTFAEGWRESMETTIAGLRDMGAMAGNIVTQISTNMQQILGDFFNNILTGQINSAKQVFVEFGNFVLRLLSDIIAQIITTKVMAGIASLLAPTANVAGMGTVLIKPFQEGTESVPYTGMARVHEGERITPKYDAKKSGEMTLTIVNQITTGFINAAIASEPDTVVNVISQDTLMSRQTRRTYKRTMR